MSGFVMSTANSKICRSFFFLSQVCMLCTSWPALVGRVGGLEVSEDGGGRAALVGAECCARHRLARRNFSAFQPHTRAGALGHTGYTACITDLPLSAPASASTTAAGVCIEEFSFWRLKLGIQFTSQNCILDLWCGQVKLQWQKRARSHTAPSSEHA